MIPDRRPASSRYVHYLSRVNKHFQAYFELLGNQCDNVILHFTTKQLLGFPRILEVCENDDGTGGSVMESHLTTQQFEIFYSNVQRLRSLKVSCSDNFSTDLRFFRSLEQLHLIGPYLRAVKGLRIASSNLKVLIIEKCHITLHDLVSDCCLDHSGPMSWPCLVSLKVSHCALKALDSALKLLPSLEELDVSFNKLSALGNEIWYLESLTRLDISFNRLKSTPQLQGGARWQLQVLKVSYNELSSLEGLQNLENLKQLDISYNLLTSHRALQPLRHLCYLEELNLIGNPLSCHRSHRLLSLQSISPTSIKPAFTLDGMQLSNKDLRSVMYTPVATTLSAAVGPNFTSINSLEPERYDVSMSSAPSAAHGKIAHVSSFGRGLKQRARSKSSKISDTPVTRDQPNTTDLPEEPAPAPPDDEHEEAGSLFGTPRSSGSSFSVTTSADFDRESDCSYAASIKSDDDNFLAERLTTYSCHENDHYAVYGQENSSGCDIKHLVAASPGNDAETLNADADEEHITPPLHVKREVKEASADIGYHLPGPEEVYVAATQDDLLERDIETGKILERLELSTVSDVSLTFVKEMPVLDVKFTYLQKNRRTRRYTVLDQGANEAARLLHREIESYLHCNRSVKSQNYICLKCSQAFQVENQNSVLDSYSLHNVPATSGDIYGLTSVRKKVVCHCGSDMIVEAEAKPPVSSIFDIGKDECEEATEASVEINSESLPIKIENDASRSTSKPMGQAAGMSLSWIHSLQAIQNASRTFEEGQDIRQSSVDQHHLSSSLPNDLSASVLLKEAGKSAAASVFHKSNQPNTPFKTFTHLLTAHDLYKLVDVTPAINPFGAKNFPSVSGRPLEYKYSQSVTPGELTNDDRRIVATSTPRRRTSLPVMDFSTSFLEANKEATVGTSVYVGDRKRALNFDDTALPQLDSSRSPLFIEYYKSLSGETQPGQHQSYIPPQLKGFIIEEILEAEEELCAIVSARIIVESGGTLSSLDPKAIRNRSHSSSYGNRNDSLGSEKSVGQKSKNESLDSSNRHYTMDITEVLLLLTTNNIMLLKVSDAQWLSLDSSVLQCMATHSLRQVIGLELGFFNFVLYFAVTDISANTSAKGSKLSAMDKLMGKRNKFKLSSLGEVYAAHFHASESCERFYQSWKGLLDSRLSELSLTALGVQSTNAHNSSSTSISETERSPLSVCSSYFADALEKNFYEHVLVNLNLGTLEMVVSDDDLELAQLLTILTEKLFIYVPCWQSEGEAIGSTRLGLVMSCGGSLVLVVEEHNLAMHEFARALVDAKNAQDSSTSIHSVHLPAVPPLSLPIYSVKSLMAISDLKKVSCSKEQPLSVEFTFVTEDVMEESSWHLTFESLFAFRNILDIIKACTTISDPDFKIVWQ